jgi:hypothetical protein
LLGFFVILFKLPIAIVATAALCVWALVFFAIETPLAAVSFPFVAVAVGRSGIGTTWPGTYPRSLRWFFSSSEQDVEGYETRSREIPALFGLSTRTETYNERVVRTKKGGLKLIADVWAWVLL